MHTINAFESSSAVALKTLVVNTKAVVNSQHANGILLFSELGMPKVISQLATVCFCLKYSWGQEWSSSVVRERLWLQCKCRSLRGGWGLCMCSVEVSRLNFEKISVQCLKKALKFNFSSRNYTPFLSSSLPTCTRRRWGSRTVLRKLWVRCIFGCNECSVCWGLSG